MTTTTLELNKPTQGDTNWHIPINANFDSIDSKLGQAYKYLYEIDGVTYISSNAKYVTDHWERWDTSKGAYLIKIDGDNNTKTEYYCLAGLGEITWVEFIELNTTTINTYNKDIINLNKIGSNTILRLFGSDPKIFETTTTATFSSKLIDVGHIKAIVYAERSECGSGTRIIKILNNGIEVWSASQDAIWSDPYAYPEISWTVPDIEVEAGDVLTIERVGGCGAISMELYSTAIAEIVSIIS